MSRHKSSAAAWLDGLPPGGLIWPFGSLSSREMSYILLGCLDEICLSTESMKPTGGDLFATLANFRYRIEPHLEAASLALKWKVGPMERLAPGSSRMPQIMRIANEAISNVLKHSESGLVRVSGQVEAD